METPTRINEGPTEVLDLHSLKSKNSVRQIERLHNALSNLEEKCNHHVANKFLIGFLEEKGVNTYEEFINNLI